MDSFVVTIGISLLINLCFGALLVFKQHLISLNLSDHKFNKPYITIASIGTTGTLLLLAFNMIQDGESIILKELLLFHVLYWVSITDFTDRVIPNRLLLFGVIGLFLIVLIKPGSYQYFNLSVAFIVGFIGILVNLLSNYFFKSQGFGSGDIKLLMLISAFLGVKVGVFFMLAVILAGSISFLLLITDKISRKSRIPFAPFIFLSFLLIESTNLIHLKLNFLIT